VTGRGLTGSGGRAPAPCCDTAEVGQQQRTPPCRHLADLVSYTETFPQDMLP